MLDEIRQFLLCETPESWLEAACADLPLILVDHANCEKKAAATAMNLMYRYPEKAELLSKMSQLAREELLHFEQVVGLMQERAIVYLKLGPSRYAGRLRSLIGNGGNELVDILIIGAYIEARSCERFAALAPRLEQQDSALAKYYLSLLRSEGRHYRDYLDLAANYSRRDIGRRVGEIGEVERELITSPDVELRFHSGVPA